MEIITGYKGEPHVTAQMYRNINRGIFGNDVYVANLANGDTLTASIASANQIVIGAGLIVAQGCAAEIPHGTSEVVTIENGTQLMQRRDLIAVQYTKADGTAVESMALRVIKGTPAASNPEQPGYNGGEIVNGSRVRDFPLFEVFLDGLTIERIERLVPVVDAVADMSEQIESVRLVSVSYPFVINYITDTPGTRGARVTLTTNYKADAGYDDADIVGMVVKDFAATTTMNVVPTVNGTTIYVSAYRASSAAATNVTGTLVVTCKHSD